MATYGFKSIIGDFLFNEHGKIIARQISPNARPPDTKMQAKILECLSAKEHWADYRRRNIELTKSQIKDCVTDDIHIGQAINASQELGKILNMLSKRLREWYSYFNPEFAASISDNEKFIELIMSRPIESLLKEIGCRKSMGAVLPESDRLVIMEYAKSIRGMYEQRMRLESYLDGKLKKIAPNIQAVGGTLISAKLIEHAGSLKRLAMMPASTVQLLGAEKALFRHLKNKNSKCPKFGVIFNHPLIGMVKRPEQGKVARALADKLSMAAKIDYFKGQFIGDRMRTELERKFKK